MQKLLFMSVLMDFQGRRTDGYFEGNHQTQALQPFLSYGSLGVLWLAERPSFPFPTNEKASYRMEMFCKRLFLLCSLTAFLFGKNFFHSRQQPADIQHRNEDG